MAAPKKPAPDAQIVALVKAQGVVCPVCSRPKILDLPCAFCAKDKKKNPGDR